ncbi:MAG TPA: hypothetical protein VGH89_08000 [Pseudonocardia sp.]|jgi:hypothetical protein
MAELVVTRLMQNPLGQIAPAGHRGDMVRVSDGASTVYLLPAEFEALDDDMVRTALALAAHRKVTATEPSAPPPSHPAQPQATRPTPVPRKPTSVTTTGGPDDKAGSLTSPRRAGRPAQSLW